MSYELLAHTSNLSDVYEEVVNPFTGEVSKQPVGEAVTEVERHALLALLSQNGAEGPDELGGFVVHVDGRDPIEFSLFGIDEPDEFRSGCISLHSLTHSIAGFVFEMARDANLVIQYGPDAKLVCMDNSIVERVADRWPEVQVVGSLEEFHEILKPGFEAWVEFKDHAVESIDLEAFDFDAEA